MRTNVEIENKLYSDIVSYCAVNGIEPVKYIEKALRERLATDKYGDLNQKFHKVEEPVEATVTKEEINIVSYEPLTCDSQIQKVYDVSKPNEFSSGMDALKEEKQKKRQLKTR